MKYKLKIIDESCADFGQIKKSGFGGVIFTEEFCNTENIQAAKRQKLKSFLYIRDLSAESCCYLDLSGVTNGSLYTVTLKTVKRTVKKLGKKADLLDGFIFPTPFLKGLLWNDAFPILYEDFCGEDIRGELPVILDKHAENVTSRVWYYNMSERLLFLDYILPVSEYLKALGKKACFDFGHADKGIELIKKQLNPFWFKKKGIPILYETQEGITLLYGSEPKKQNLLVLPLRAIMLNYAYGEKYSRRETPFVLAVSEEEYYKTSLKKCNIDCNIVDERAFSDIKTNKLKEFENIIICDACALSDADSKRIKELKSAGHKVNEKAFLDILDSVN